MNFEGWCREGFWSNGSLLNGKDGRTVNLAKFLCHKPQEARRPAPARVEVVLLNVPQWGAVGVGRDGSFHFSTKLEIPTFMESHL